MRDAPELAQVASPVDFGSVDMPFLKTMRKVCSFTDTGIGLAAPQIGVMKRAIFIWPGRAGMGRFLINPEILWRSDTNVKMQEGCLSYPGIYIDLWRSEKIRVHFYDERWKECRETFDGMECRIILHEIDHLEGVCRVGEEWRMRNNLMPACQVCGCTDDDCRACIQATGSPCYWVKPGLCSRCADAARAIGGVA